MNYALFVFVLIGLAAVALLAASVRSALPAIVDLRRALAASGQPVVYQFQTVEPVREARRAMRAKRKTAAPVHKVGAVALNPKRPARRPAAAAA